MLVAVIRSQGDHRRWIVVGLAGLAISYFGTALRAPAVQVLPKSGSVHIEATVIGDLQLRQGRVVGQSFRERSGTVAIRVEQVIVEDRVRRVRAPARLFVDADFPEITPGSRVALEVRLLPRTDDAVLMRATSSVRVLADANQIQKAAQRIRMGLRAAAVHLPKRFGGLLPGLVDGDTVYLDASLRRDMQDTSLTHLTAVSGANLALVAGFILYIARGIGVRRRYLPVISAGAIAMFVVIARPDPSVLRAAVMAAVLIVASASELPAAGFTSLMVAILLLILIDPSQGSKPGFVLSILATAGILLFAGSWSGKLERLLPRPLAVAIAMPLAAQALCTPYLVLISQQLSLVGVWTNVLVAPAVAPATILGFVGGLLSLVSPVLATACAWLAAPALWLISSVALFGAGLPFANIRWAPGWQGVVLASVLVLTIFIALWLKPRTTMIGYLIFLTVLTFLRTASPLWPMTDWSMAMCDVGQGDGLVLRVSRSEAIVVDAGPSADLIDRCLKDLRIRKVPVVILSHNHADHVEGLQGVLHRRDVGQVWISPELEPLFEAKRVKRWVGSRPLRVVTVNQTFRVGDLVITAVWPNERIASGSIPNNSSVVLTAQWRGYAGKVLLLGDVEAEAQESLASQIHGPYDIVKVAHHGSANQHREWIADLRPRVALISVGSLNPYGHPSVRTIEAFSRVGARVYRTDRDGPVAIAMSGNGMRVAARGHPWWSRR